LNLSIHKCNVKHFSVFFWCAVNSSPDVYAMAGIRPDRGPGKPNCCWRRSLRSHHDRPRFLSLSCRHSAILFLVLRKLGPEGISRQRKPEAGWLALRPGTCMRRLPCQSPVRAVAACWSSPAPPPSFCSFCGHALSETTPEAAIPLPGSAPLTAEMGD